MHSYYARPRVNIKSRVSIFGTQKGTPETYLLNCVFNLYKPDSIGHAYLADDKIEVLQKEFPKYVDCFKHSDEIMHKSFTGAEYRWEFIPSKEFLTEYSDKLNHGFFVLNRDDRFVDGVFQKGYFNPNQEAYMRQMKSEYFRKKKKGEIKKTTLNNYLEKRGAK